VERAHVVVHRRARQRVLAHARREHPPAVRVDLAVTHVLHEREQREREPAHPAEQVQRAHFSFGFFCFFLGTLSFLAA
jgi:hypothetical protein